MFFAVNFRSVYTNRRTGIWLWLIQNLKIMYKKCAIFILFSFLLFSCNSDNSGWLKPTAAKFEYKVVETADSKKEASTLDYGDEIMLHFTLTKEDGTKIENSYSKNAPVRIILPTKMHRNAFEEVLTFAKPGDSIIARIRYLDAHKELANYKSHFSGKNERVVWTYKILGVYTQKQKSEEKDRKYAKMNGFATLEEFKTEQQRILKEDSTLRSNLLSDIKKYKSGELKTEKTADGLEIYYKQKGKGSKPEAGKTVYFYFIAAIIKEETIFDDVFKLGARMILTIGKSDNLPKMFHRAVSHLQKGDKAVIFVPANLAYGAKGSLPVVPPNSDLALYIETVDIK